MPTKPILACGLWCAAFLVLAGCDFLRGYAEGRSAPMLKAESQSHDRVTIGTLRFMYDDFGGLNTDTLQTNALPWKVVAAALVLEQAAFDGGTVNQAALQRTLARFGFIFPERIGNAPRDIGALPRPLGLVTGTVSRRLPHIELEAANIGCAACHAGVLYDERGRPSRTVWLGLPNTSLNIEAYTRAVYSGLKQLRRRQDDLSRTIRALFPQTSEAELRTIERHIMPRMVRRLDELERSGDAPTPFDNGGPGLTNGVASLKYQLQLTDAESFRREVGFTSIPDLGNVALRSSLLYDGLYAPPAKARFTPRGQGDITPAHVSELAAITTFFTVPTMGIHPRRARAAIPRVEQAYEFIRRYRSPPFPGPVNLALARDGRKIYAAHCSGCHGSYEGELASLQLTSFPNRLVPLAEIGTDPARVDVIDPGVRQAIASSGYGQYIDTAQTGGYVATRLSGLWASAPYLHNGSVPTLWHLMTPGARPERFYVGGHMLDYTRIGIAGELDESGTYVYPLEHKPWSEPQLYDTRQPGKSNRGHAREFEGMSDAEKAKLLEFLKLL